MPEIKSISTISERNKFDGSLIYNDDSFDEKTGRVEFLESRIKQDKNLWFIDKKNSSIYEEYREIRSCPVCDSMNFSVIFVKEGFDHVKCNNCSFVFVSPVLKDSALMEHYKSENRWTKVMLSQEEIKTNNIMYNLVLSFLGKENRFNSKMVLDIGSGSGTFLDVARAGGWNTKGIEYNKEMIKTSKNNKLDVSDYSLKSLKNQETLFDVITTWFVLEHIKDIKKFMEDVVSILKNEGLLFIGVPQVDALVNRLYGKDSPTFSGYSHINFFNHDSLNRFITQFGFELVAQETHITQLNNIKKYFDSFGVSETSGLNSLLRDITPSYIHNNMLGSNLISIYRKFK